MKCLWPSIRRPADDGDAATLFVVRGRCVRRAAHRARPAARPRTRVPAARVLVAAADATAAPIVVNVRTGENKIAVKFAARY